MFLVPPGNPRRADQDRDEFVDFEVPVSKSDSMEDARLFARDFSQRFNLSYCTIMAEPLLTPVIISPELPDDV